MSDPTLPSAPGGIDWNKVLDDQEKDPGFKPVPTDKYRVRIDKAEAVKAGTGADMIKVQAKVVGGPYDTKMIFTNIVFTYDNPVAVKFTLRKLKGLGLSEEMLRAQNPSPAQIANMIVGVEAEADVVEKPATTEYEASNDIKGFRSLTAGAGVPAPPSVAAAPAPAPAAAPEIPKPTIPDAPSVEAQAAPAAGEAPEPF